MDSAAALVLLFLLGSAGGASSTPEHSDPGGNHSGGEPPPKDPKDTAALDAARGALGVLGALGSIGGAGGTAAAGGAVAGGAGAAGTAGGSTVAGAGGTTAAAGTAGAAAGGSTGVIAVTGAAGEVIGAVAASSAAGVGIIVGVIMLFVIARRIVDAQENDKDWQSYCLNLNATAHALHRLECQIVEGILSRAGRTFTVAQIRDFRLDRYMNGSKTVSRGYRSAYRFIPIPGDVDLFRRSRALVFEYLRLRAGHGYRMIRNWSVVNPPQDWGISNASMFSMFNGALQGLGGLASIPHAAGGGTVSPRTVADGDEDFDPYEQISNEVFTNTNGIVLTEGELQVARLLAFLDAIRVLKHDPRPAIEADRRWYADEVFRALSWTGPLVEGSGATPTPTGVKLSGEALELDPAWFGVRRYIYPARIKLLQSGWMTE